MKSLAASRARPHTAPLSSFHGQRRLHRTAETGRRGVPPMTKRTLCYVRAAGPTPPQIYPGKIYRGPCQRRLSKGHNFALGPDKGPIDG